MHDTLTIRIKAFLLTAIFAGNFLVVCHCSASDAGPSVPAPVPDGCCCKKSHPCKEPKRCPGTQAVKFNLLEKKAAAEVQLGPNDGVPVTRVYGPAAAVRGGTDCRGSSAFLMPLHAPPDRLALYHFYLV